MQQMLHRPASHSGLLCYLITAFACQSHVLCCGTQTTEATLELAESKVQMAPAARVKRSKGAG